MISVTMLSMIKTTKKAATAAGDAKMLKIVTMVLVMLDGIRYVDAKCKQIILYNVLFYMMDTEVTGLDASFFCFRLGKEGNQ